VNNNVQGVTNSVLVGSKVVTRDPGPRVSSRHHQPRRDGSRRREGKRISRQQQKAKMTKIVSIVVVAVVSLLFVAAAATGLYLYPFVGVRQ
jgi:cobalamin biosynthesis Mg chelatase CobN